MLHLFQKETSPLCWDWMRTEWKLCCSVNIKLHSPQYPIVQCGEITVIQCTLGLINVKSFKSNWIESTITLIQLSCPIGKEMLLRKRFKSEVKPSSMKSERVLFHRLQAQHAITWDPGGTELIRHTLWESSSRKEQNLKSLVKKTSPAFVSPSDVLQTNMDIGLQLILISSHLKKLLTKILHFLELKKNKQKTIFEINDTTDNFN